ncbi:mitochondrial cardiolipin hydrolase isoform X3 [Belonocnema kinseyi]|uniref:mitochondrial cardiolipin hydrolase isoform X3 n=1 Tax=Belonocnema kinseyi TaxID=2817044 RepID=UPI00143CDFC3|nr:mitochondrial cardiolipin hydrolase isoform X3 [Belonocnema kinseyi]
MNKRTIIIVVAGVLASEVAWHFYKKYKNKIWQPANRTRAKVLFSSEESVLCKPHLKSRIPCERNHCPVRTLNELQRVMTSATQSLDVCVYFLTHPILIDAIVEVFNKNVPVRIITDGDMSDNSSSTGHILKLRRHGIKIDN